MKIEEMKQEIENKIFDKEKEIEALRNVVIKKKKDGTNFKRLSQAIEGGKIVVDYINSSYEQTWLDVDYKGVHYNTCRIVIYGKMLDLPETDMRRRKLKTQPAYADTYTFTPNEIQAAIDNQIENDKKYIIELKETLENFDNIVNPLIEKAKELYCELKKVNVLNYEVTEAVHHMIRFGYVY